MYCIVKDCGSVWNPTSNVIFHSFPRDSEKRQKWLSTIQLKGKFYESAKICSLHFKPENYDPSRPKRLLISAVPVYSVQLCSCGNSVKACTTPFKCSASPDVMTQTKADTCSTVSEKERSYCEKDMQLTHSENIVVNENEPPAKRRRLKDVNVQCKIKTLREKCLEKNKKALQQRVARNKQKIKDLKSLVNIDRNYTSQSEIENILQGNFAEICKYFNKKAKVTPTTYSDEVKVDG